MKIEKEFSDFRVLIDNNLDDAFLTKSMDMIRTELDVLKATYRYVEARLDIDNEPLQYTIASVERRLEACAENKA